MPAEPRLKAVGKDKDVVQRDRAYDEVLLLAREVLQDPMLDQDPRPESRVVDRVAVPEGAVRLILREPADIMEERDHAGQRQLVAAEPHPARDHPGVVLHVPGVFFLERDVPTVLIAARSELRDEPTEPRLISVRIVLPVGHALLVPRAAGGCKLW